MNKTIKRYFFILLSAVSVNAEQLTDSIRVDGYLNVDIYSSSKENIDRAKFSGGLQGRYQVSDSISVTGQIHLKEGKNSLGEPSNSLTDYDSELKWLYLDYYLFEDITLRVGAFQFPIFKSSETGDIGYSYTWTESPLRSYGVFGCDDFEGGEILKNFTYEDIDFLAQLSFGKSTNELDSGVGESLEGDVDNLIGLTLKASTDLFKLNIGYLEASTKLDVINQALEDSEVDFNMYAMESEIYFDNYTFKAGLIKTNLTNVFAEDLNYYSSLEYNYNDITPYILYSNETMNFKNNSNMGSGNAQTKKGIVEKYSIGVRYDYNANIALKFGFTQEENRRTYYSSDSSDYDESHTYTGTINVIF